MRPEKPFSNLGNLFCNYLLAISGFEDVNFFFLLNLTKNFIVDNVISTLPRSSHWWREREKVVARSE